jgi:O-antigen/teichoic acid export membrane protein
LINTKQLKEWGAGSAISITDQGLLSLSNFAINIHLSRILAPDQYGLFAIIFSVYLLILSFVQALILEPLNIVGMTRYKKGLMTYFIKVAIIQFVISLALSLVVALVASIFLYTHNDLALPLFALVVASPFMSLFFLLRRFCYLLSRPLLALIGTVVYITLLITGYYCLVANSDVNTAKVMFLFGLVSCVCSIVIAVILYHKIARTSDHLVSSKVVLFKHWKLGKWVLGGTIVGWLSTSIYFPLVASFSGLEAAAAFKAVDNLLLPMQQVVTALSLIIVPRLAANFNKGFSFLRMAAIRLSIFFSIAVLVYLLVLFLGRNTIVHMLYGSSNNYIEYTWLIPLMGSTLLARAIVDIGIGSSLRVLERFDVLFKSLIINSGFSLTLGIYLVWRFGILGAGLSITMASMLQILTTIYYFQNMSILERTKPSA